MKDFWKYVFLAAAFISAAVAVTSDAKPRVQHRELGGFHKAASGLGISDAIMYVHFAKASLVLSTSNYSLF
jgi:hypothetical protein